MTSAKIRLFCAFPWPYMVKWHNSGIINNNIHNEGDRTNCDWVANYYNVAMGLHKTVKQALQLIIRRWRTIINAAKKKGENKNNWKTNKQMNFQQINQTWMGTLSFFQQRFSSFLYDLATNAFIFCKSTRILAHRNCLGPQSFFFSLEFMLNGVS